MELTHASFFSGVGGLDLGLEQAGWHTVSQSEIEPFPSAVLRSRFPDVPNLGDITAIAADDIPDAILWSGGFPCQDLSIAGKRAGFAGDRSSLAFTFLNLVEAKKPSWLLLENVPGLLSSNQGRDFGRLLGEMDELGYGLAWRVLDARYFGVAQRRRRVFIVGSLGSERAGEVLFESESSDGDSESRLAPRARIAGNLADGSDIVGTVPAALDHHGYTLGQEAFTGFVQSVAATLNSGGNSGGFRTEPGEHLVTVRTTHAVVGPATNPNGVRAPHGMAGRLDDTNPAGMDSARYKAIGNGVVSPVAEWIGRRIGRLVET